MIVGSIQG